MNRFIQYLHLIFGNKTILNLFQKISGTKIYKSIPYGVDFFNDVNEHLGNYTFEVIFDVGANIGQSAQYFREKKKNSKILSFEPFEQTFNQLKKNVKKKDIECYNIAFGSKNENIKANYDLKKPYSVKNSLSEKSKPKYSKECIIKVEKLDDFIFEKKIEKINYLKIDTEGFDLEVLKGCKKTLSESKIDFIEIEAGMNPTNKIHVSFTNLKNFLEENNYFIFGFYEQINEKSFANGIYLRRSNVVFVSNKVNHECFRK